MIEQNVKEEYDRVAARLTEVFEQRDKKQKKALIPREFSKEKQLSVLSLATKDAVAEQLIQESPFLTELQKNLFLTLRECFKLYVLLGKNEQVITNSMIDTIVYLDLWEQIVVESSLTPEEELRRHAPIAIGEKPRPGKQHRTRIVTGQEGHRKLYSTLHRQSGLGIRDKDK